MFIKVVFITGENEKEKAALAQRFVGTDCFTVLYNPEDSLSPVKQRGFLKDFFEAPERAEGERVIIFTNSALIILGCPVADPKIFRLEEDGKLRRCMGVDARRLHPSNILSSPVFRLEELFAETLGKNYGDLYPQDSWEEVEESIALDEKINRDASIGKTIPEDWLSLSDEVIKKEKEGRKKKGKEKIKFTFRTRQGMQVASAVAEAVNALKFGAETKVRPVLLSTQGDTFRFEGGTVVKVNLIDLDQFTESWRTPHAQDWVVTHCTVRYRPYYPCGEPPKKVQEEWNHEKLLQVKENHPWWHPRVMDIDSITGIVGIFFDRGAWDGEIEVDPEYNQSGHYTMVNIIEYRRFVPGDLQRALKEARENLAKLLAD